MQWVRLHCTHNIQSMGADNAFCTRNILEQNNLFMKDKRKRSRFVVKFCKTLVNITVIKVAGTKASANMLTGGGGGFVPPSDLESPAVNAKIPSSQRLKKTREPDTFPYNFVLEKYKNVRTK